MSECQCCWTGCDCGCVEVCPIHGDATMTDDLRALANDYARAYDGVEGGISRLAHAVLTLLTSLEAAEQKREAARSDLASLADVVNQELRESREGVEQVNLGEDLRPFIRYLVDVNRGKVKAAERRAEKAEAALVLVVRAAVLLEGREEKP